MQKMEMTLHGYFDRFLWRDEKSGSSLFVLQTREEPLLEDAIQSTKTKRALDGRDEKWYGIVVCAMHEPVPRYRIKMPLTVSGVYEDTVQKGRSRSFRLSSLREALDVLDEDETAQYLAAYIPADAAARTAAALKGKADGKLFSRLGDPTLVIDLMAWSGLPREKVLPLVAAMRQTVAQRELFDAFQGLDIPYAFAERAIDAYGESAKDLIASDPYRVGAKFGLSFKQADALAHHVGIRDEDPRRLAGMVTDALRSSEASGNTWMSYAQFENRLGWRFQDRMTALEAAPYGPKVRHEENRILDIRLTDAESRIARNLIRLGNQPKDPAYRDSLVDYAEAACHKKYGSQQRAAFPLILKSPGVKVFTGGPGTGKTSTILGIIKAFSKMHPGKIVKLCAPTGRAAQRLSESTGMPATTVHRLIDYRPFGGDQASCKNASDPIEADFIVVDETSMMNVELFDLFLDAVPTGATLVLVGDPNQLEAVGAGAVLRDLLQSGETLIPRTHLTEVFRQKGSSPIVENAARIQQGRSELIRNRSDFIVLNTKSAEDTAEQVMKIMRYAYKPEDPFAVQVLCPSKIGPAGIDALNKRLQEELNPHGGRQLVYGGHAYMAGDKIIMTRNNYETGYFNGDIGVVKAVRDGQMVVTIRETEITLTTSLMDDVRLAYAMTDHKSQGSEFPMVVVVLPREPAGMLTRNLFYTALTRAKQNVVVLNERGAMEQAIRVSKADERQTTLVARLKQMAAEKEMKEKVISIRSMSA